MSVSLCLVEWEKFLKQRHLDSCICCCCYLLNHVWLFCNPVHCSLPSSSVHGVSQARILGLVVISFSRGACQPRDWTSVSYISRQILYHLSQPGKPIPPARHTLFLIFLDPPLSFLSLKWKWSCSVMSDSLQPHGLQPTGSSFHGIFQARVLEWIAISFSRGSSPPRGQTPVSCIVGRCFTIWATREVSFLNYLFNYHLVCWSCLNTQYTIAPPASLSFIPGFIFFIESVITGYSL